MPPCLPVLCLVQLLWGRVSFCQTRSLPREKLQTRGCARPSAVAGRSRSNEPQIQRWYLGGPYAWARFHGLYLHQAKAMPEALEPRAWAWWRETIFSCDQRPVQPQLCRSYFTLSVDGRHSRCNHEKAWRPSNLCGINKKYFGYLQEGSRPEEETRPQHLHLQDWEARQAPGFLFQVAVSATQVSQTLLHFQVLYAYSMV